MVCLASCDFPSILWVAFLFPQNAQNAIISGSIYYNHSCVILGEVKPTFWHFSSFSSFIQVYGTDMFIVFR